jgi:carbonic anhydrase
MSSKDSFAGSLGSLSAAALSLILLWLTVSLPYTMCPGPGSSSIAEEQKPHPQNPAMGGGRRPWMDMTDEKATESSNTPREECLHEHPSGPEAGSMDRNTYVNVLDDTPCICFEGVLLVPLTRMLRTETNDLPRHGMPLSGGCVRQGRAVHRPSTIPHQNEYMTEHSKEFLEQLTPFKCLGILQAGNERFLHNLKRDHDNLVMVNETREGQYPFAVILSCMDSRTSIELVFDQGMGDLFSIRVAGNIVNDDILASLEYAVKYVGSKLLVALGHTSCGAIRSAVAGVKDGHITELLKRIQPAISKAMLKISDDREFDDKVCYTNVENSLEEILTRSEIVRSMFVSGEIGLVGAVYNVGDGRVDFFMNLTREREERTETVNARGCNEKTC